MSRNPKDETASESSCPTASLILRHTDKYLGLKPPNSRFNWIQSHPLYKFPVIQGNTQKDILSAPDFTLAEENNLHQNLRQLHFQSPFKRGDFEDFIDPLSDQEGSCMLRNSENSSYYLIQNIIQDQPVTFNLAEEMEKDFIESNQSMSGTSISSRNSQQPERANISFNTQEMILKLHRDFTVKNQDERYLHSMTPASSLEYDSSNTSPEMSPKRPIKKPAIYESRSSFSSLHSDDFIFHPDDISLTDVEEKLKSNWSQVIVEEEEVPSSDEANVTQSRQYSNQNIVELLPEDDDEDSRFLYKSIEALRRARMAGLGVFSSIDDELSNPPEDEGSIRVSFANRLFLNGETASKQKLTNMTFSRDIVKLQPKVLTQSISNGPTTMNDTFQEIEAPESISPLIRKLVLCSQMDNNNAEISCSVPLSGFSSTPSIEYSNIDDKSRGFIDYTSKKPVIVQLLNQRIAKELIQTQILWLSCGFEHCAAISIERKVLTWGYGASGCLGHGDTSTYPHPTLVNSLFEHNANYLECGGYHNAIVTDEGKVFTWGRGDVHQLGVSQQKLCKDEIGHVALRPLQVKGISNGKSVACGEAHTLVLSESGELYAFGWGEDGQLGISLDLLKDRIMTSQIQKVASLQNRVIKVGAGSIFSACLTDCGELYIWGNGELGQLGLGSRVKQIQYPQLVQQLKDITIIDFVCGESHVICLSEQGKLFGWGQGIAGNFQKENFNQGSEIVCFLPRCLTGVDIAHKFLFKETSSKFTNNLMAKLAKIV